MSYQIYQFNMGTGEAQAFVLKGEGTHEGTNETIPARELNEAMAAIRFRLGQQYSDYEPLRFTLLKEKPGVDPRELSAVAEYLDLRFLRAHARRLAAQGIVTEGGDAPAAPVSEAN